jgi:hypothetical protein
MIAAVKGWPAALSAFLFFLPPGATAAEDSNGAARELARKTVLFAGRGEPVVAVWRNVSSLGSGEFAQARAAFEAALKDAGGRLSDLAPVIEAHLTLSENRSHYLLVEEVRKGEERQVWIASWNRGGAPSLTAPAIRLEKKLVWEQEEPMLDAAFSGGGMLVLSASRVTLVKGQGQTVSALPARGWPRDLRGHLRVAGATFQAFLPGMVCSGALEPALAMDCRTSEEPWVIESGSRTLLLAAFAAARNYFDGRVTSQSGLRKTLAPFYSAASVEVQGRTLWLLAMVDGRTQILDAALEPVATLNATWGSDIAGTDGRCGGGGPVLATRAGDASAADAVQAFSIADRAATPLTAPVEFPGPVVALWSSGGSGAVAIVRNPGTGKYEAYSITIACS